MNEQTPQADAAPTWRVAPVRADQTLPIRARKVDLLGEQRDDWENGRPAPPESYLTRWPVDPASDPDAASLIVAEIERRRELGEEPDLDDYRARFPELSRSVTAMLRRHDLLRTLGARKRGGPSLLRLPEVGETLFGFRLRQPLGQGAFARVFLAEQADLADRPVVVKVSAIEGCEPQTLARLQHTNIVPIYSVHEDPKAGLRAVCMPYLGGSSLSTVLEQLWDEHPQPTEGRLLAEALEAVASPSPASFTPKPRGEAPAELATIEPEQAQTILSALRDMSYTQAVAWIVAQLAEGLHHAHQRGVLHRDIKPSNILIDAEGQPLLLDFNVAQEEACDPAQALLGGTVAYAAPEHLRALRDRTADAIAHVDRRSDLYSLGLVLGEMLTGERLFDQGGSYSAAPSQLDAMASERAVGVPSLRQSRPDIPWDLESIARHCLDPDPDRRYQQADHLAEDLRRFLEDRPLRHAPELSRVEQVRKFFRRHPRMLTTGSIASIAAVILLAIGSALIGTKANLDEARARERRRAFDASSARALCLVNTTLGHRDHLRQGVALCEQALALYYPPGTAPGFEHPDLERLPPAERTQVAQARRELLLLLAGARVRLAPNSPRATREALALLDRAEAIPGLPASKALWLDRSSYLDRLGDQVHAREARKQADATQPADARDHYLVAISHARAGTLEGFRQAIADLDAALQLNPRHYWSTIQRGMCRMELGELTQALGDFGAAVGLGPDQPYGFYNRGCVYDRLGLKRDAIADYSAALERDPSLIAARTNRALARLDLREHRQALEDLDRSLELGGDADARIQLGRGIALEALGRGAEADKAFASAFAHSDTNDSARPQLLWAYGFAVSNRRPDLARQAFAEVIRGQPRHPQAHYGLAMLAMASGATREAITHFDHALEADPAFLEARRYRAIALARVGDRDRATRDINGCLERDPRSGDNLYAAACVHALAAEPSRAIDLLKQARARGAGANAAADPDLAPLRGDPRFAQVVGDSPGSARAN
jgi:serine/threonine protein kinase/tetratricopeptide (TPR) repeat protein